MAKFQSSDTGCVLALEYESSVADASSSGNNGTLVGGATYHDSGIKGKCLTLDGSGDYVTHGHAASFDFTSACTISAWIYKPSFNPNQTIISKRSAWSSTGIPFEFNTDGGNITVRFIGNTVHSVAHGMSINTWYHVVATWDGSTVKMYINNAEVFSTAFSGTITTNAADVTVGALPDGSENFDGRIDRLFVYNLAKSTTDIADEYNQFVHMTSSKADSATGTALSVAMPTGTTTGDFVVVLAQANGQTTIVDNNGSTPFTEDINDYKPNTTNGHTLSIFSRTIQGGDPSTYAFTSGASGRWSLIAIRFYHTSSPSYDVSPSTSNASNTDDASSGTMVNPAITTVAAYAVHVTLGCWDTSAYGTITTPTGYSIIQNANTAGEPMHASFKNIITPGSTGTTTIVNTEFGARIGLSFSVKGAGGVLIKTKNGLAQASIKTYNGLATASVKSVNGLSNV